MMCRGNVLMSAWESSSGAEVEEKDVLQVESWYFEYGLIRTYCLIRSFSRTDFYQYDSHIKNSDNSNPELGMSG